MDSSENSMDFGAAQIHNWNLILHLCSCEHGEANLEFSFPLIKEAMGVENGRGTYPSFTGHWYVGCLCSYFKMKLGPGIVAQWLECLLSMHEALGLIPGTTENRVW